MGAGETGLSPTRPILQPDPASVKLLPRSSDQRERVLASVRQHCSGRRPCRHSSGKARSGSGPFIGQDACHDQRRQQRQNAEHDRNSGAPTLGGKTAPIRPFLRRGIAGKGHRRALSCTSRGCEHARPSFPAVHGGPDDPRAQQGRSGPRPTTRRCGSAHTHRMPPEAQGNGQGGQGLDRLNRPTHGGPEAHFVESCRGQQRGLGWHQAETQTEDRQARGRHTQFAPANFRPTRSPP